MKVYRGDAFGRLTVVKEFTGTHSSPIWANQHSLLYATTTYTYSVLDNLTDVWDAANNHTQADGSVLAEYGYDEGMYGIGHRTVMTDGVGVTEWVYDQRGRALAETRHLDGIGTYTTATTYDAMDRMVSMTYPGGEVITTTYNAMGLPEALTSSLGETYVVSASYTAEGRLDLMSLGSDLRINHDYYDWDTVNGQGRLASIQAGTSYTPTLLQNLSYVYDAVGNVQSLTGNGQTTTFTYDPLDRLTGASGEYSESYSYNEIGNLTYKSGVGSYSYDSGKPHAVTSAGGNSYGYDLNGNMVSRSVGVTYTLSYGIENRLQAVTNTATSEVTTFSYDGDGRRAVQKTMTDTIVYVGSLYEKRFPLHDLNADCLVNVVDIMLVVARWSTSVGDPDYDPTYDLDGDGDIDIADIMQVASHWRERCTTVKYYTLGGQRVAMREDNTLYYLFSDHLGSTSVSYDTGNDTWTTQRYHPYGSTRSGESPTDRLFTGQRFDGAIGLYQMGARFYDPALGHFVQADTIVPNPVNPQSLNRYSYVYNRPLVYVDDSGHIPIIPIIVSIVVVGSKVVDYALTAYDAWQSGRVLADPNASRGDKMMAGLNVGLAAVFEALEPDDVLPVGLPVDDVARKALLKGAREALEEGGAEGLEKYIRSNLGEHADEVLDYVYGVLCCGGQRHHVLSSKIMGALDEHRILHGMFERSDVIVQALDDVSHRGYQSWHRAYDDEVVEWLVGHAGASKKEFLDFLIEIYSRPDMKRRFPNAIEALGNLY